MNQWLAIREGYLASLRTFPMLRNIGRPGDCEEIIPATEAPVYLDATFWSQRTHEAEALARIHLSDSEIDRIFDEVAAVIDEDLRRFDALIAYFAQFFPDGDPGRIEDERQTAHGVKRDLAWAAIERSVGEPGFFSALLCWYERGRWPCRWAGEFPAGHVMVL
jgi:hypothetical protein